FTLSDKVEAIKLPEAISLVTRRPAQAAGFDDRGEIAIGKRADLVRVRLHEGVPIVRAVYRQGQRVI
ncbi:MAG: amidohydrolase family protein, partial [Devosia nanyangense]|nr:amidohydrolase family protein [Devosia nanyangense]